MTYCRAICSKRGQLKIQQMAFVLVALMIFFTIVLLFYFSIRYSGLREDVEDLRTQEVIETVRKMSGSPEFKWTEQDCAACIDMDKVLLLKNRTSYKGFWKNIVFLQVVKIYPLYENEECTRGNYPECNQITLIDEGKNFRGYKAFVTLCNYEGEYYAKCEIGKIVMAFEPIE